MKRPVFTAIHLAACAVPAAATILAAPFAHAQTDVEDSCKNAGGQYTKSEVSAHFGQDASLFEECCTGTGPSKKCVDYKDGVQGPTYGG
jgi:hypothetical protein